MHVPCKVKSLPSEHIQEAVNFKRSVFFSNSTRSCLQQLVDGILPFVDVGAKQPASKEALKEGVIEFDEVLRTKNNIPFGVMNNSERNIVFFAVAPKTRFRQNLVVILNDKEVA